MKIVLHICCGVCAAGAAAELIGEGHEITGYFFNPNIYPEEEYNRRLEGAREVAYRLAFPLKSGPYYPSQWHDLCRPYAFTPEGGVRCEMCFRLRLGYTQRYMLACRAEAFTTTLTISPHKSAAVVNRVGRELGGERFLSRDFKKKDGFKLAIKKAKEWGLYRQDYCGCIYSMIERSKR